MALSFSNGDVPSLALPALRSCCFFIGIHNAWDSVTYHVLMKARQKRSDWIRR